MNSYQNTQSLVLKLKHEDDIRRIRLDNPAQVSFEELQQTIASLYTDLQLSSVVIKYVDEDGDKLSITSSLEWQEAVRSFLDQEKVGTLSLLLVSRSVPAAPQSESKDDEEEDQVNFFEALVDTLKALGLEDLEVKVQSIPTQPFTPPFVPPPFFAHPGRFHHPPPQCGPSVPPPPFGHHGYPRPPWAAHHPHQPRQCPPAPFAFGGCPRRGGPGGRGCFRPPHCGQQQQQPRRQPLDETSRCTFATTGPRYAPHSQWFNCVTCGLIGAEGCCLACAEGCHKGHELVAKGPSFGFFCDCGAGAKGVQCRSKGGNKEAQVPTEKEDLMKMKVGDLKAVLEARGVSYADCVDKIHLVEKIFASSDAQASSPATEAGPSPVSEEESKPEPVEEEKKAEEPVVEEEKKEEEQEEKKDEEEKTDEEVPPQPAAENPFIEKLQFLQAMGFTDQDHNIAALVAHRGDLNGAVAALVNGN